ncbi:hypothetical protein AAMO2058_000476200 [Amorphochlora amoebiformis]
MSALNPDMGEGKIRECFHKISASGGEITKSDFQGNFSLFWHQDDDEQSDPGSGGPIGGSASFGATPNQSGSLLESSDKGFPMGTLNGSLDHTPAIETPLFQDLVPTKKKKKKKKSVFDKFKSKNKSKRNKNSTLRPLQEPGGTMNFPKYKLEQAEDIFTWIDSDGSGVITLEEMQLALEFYVGSRFKEEQMSRISDLMKVQNLQGIPKQMFVKILKDIIRRIKAKELSATVDSKGARDRKDDRQVRFDEPKYRSSAGSNASEDEVMKGFSLGLGITQESLEAKLTKEMADKEKLNKRVAELRKSVMQEKANRDKLLTNMSKDQESLLKQNKALVDANERLTKTVDEMAGELEKSKMSVLELYERITNLDTRYKNLREQHIDTLNELKKATKEVEELSEENFEIKSKLRGLRSTSISKSRVERQKSISATQMSSELARAKMALEANVQVLKEENEMLKRQVEELKAREKEQVRHLEATEASVHFWKKQVRRDSGINLAVDLADDIAQLAASSSNPNRVGTTEKDPIETPVVRQPASIPEEEDTMSPTGLGAETSQMRANDSKLLISSGASLSNATLHSDISTENKMSSHASQGLLGSSLNQYTKQDVEKKRHAREVSHLEMVRRLDEKEREHKDTLARLKSTEKKLQQARKRLDQAEKQMQQVDANSGLCCFCC